MTQQINIQLPAYERGVHLISKHIEKAISNKLPEAGLINIFIKHTSAGLTINENADPSVRTDMEAYFNVIAPENAPYYEHIYEGPDVRVISKPVY